MLKKLITSIILSITLMPILTFSKSSEEVSLFVGGNVYLQDQNSPLGNVKVYIKKFDKILAEGKTDSEGEFGLKIKTQEESFNVCIEGTSLSKIKNFKEICKVSLVYQGDSGFQIIDGVKTGKVKEIFFLDNSGKDLEEKYYSEITHSEEIQNEEEIKEHERIMQEKKEEEEARKKKEEEEAKLRAKYKLAPNSVLKAPLTKVIIKGAVLNISKNLKGYNDIEFNPSRTYIVLRKSGNNQAIVREPLPSDGMIDIVKVFPEDEPELQPLVLSIENDQYLITKDAKIKIFDDFSDLILNEFYVNSINLQPHEKNSLDDLIKTPVSFPYIGIGFLLLIIFIWRKKVSEYHRNKQED